MSAQTFTSIALTDRFVTWVNTYNQVITEVNASVPRLGSTLVGNVARSNTGTITGNTTSTTVTGTGTKFINELQPGDTITASAQNRTVVSIQDNLTLTINLAFSPAVTSQAFTAVMPANTLTISNSTVIVGNSTANVTMAADGTLKLSGKLDALSNISVANVLTVSGNTSLANITVSGTTTISNNINITGNLSISGTFDCGTV